MKRYLSTVCILIIPVILFVGFPIAHNCYIAATRNFDTEYRLNYGWVDQLPNKPKVLLMGSSTVYLGINPYILQDSLDAKLGNVINIAHHARTPIHSYYVLQSIKQSSLDSVKVIYYGLESWILSKAYYRYDHVLWGDWSMKQFIYSTNKQYIDPLPRLRGEIRQRVDSFISNCTPSYLSSNKINNHSSVASPISLGGETLKVKPKNFGGENVNDAYERHIYDYSAIQLSYLKKIKEFCDVNGTELVLLLTPRRSDWITDYKTNCANEDKEFMQLVKEYMGETVCLDHYEIIDKDINDSCLNDGIHLNEFGQRIYTDIILKDLRERLIKQQSKYQ